MALVMQRLGLSAGDLISVMVSAVNSVGESSNSSVSTLVA